MQQFTQPVPQTQDVPEPPNGVVKALDPSLATQLLPLTRLVVSKLNVRKHGSKDVATLAASIATQGLLQPLVVRPIDDKYEVICGSRRTLAFRKLNAEGHPDTDVVPCIICGLDDAAAIAASLAENVERLPMGELDQYGAFAALVREGKSDADIAKQFGITTQVVKRRLALSGLIPEVKALYRKGEIDVEELQILTLAPKERQRAYVKAGNERPHRWQLKDWLFGGEALSTKAALFPLEQYDGPIVSDLFGDAQYFGDTDAFWRLQNAAVADWKARLEGEGWPVEVIEPSRRVDWWRYESCEKADGGKAFLDVHADGRVELREGLLHQNERRKVRAADDGTPGEGSAPVARPELTAPLANYIDIVRHAAVRAALATAPDVALRLVVAHIIAGGMHWQVKAAPRSADSKAVASATQALAADATLAARREEAWLLLLPDAGRKRLAKLRAIALTGQREVSMRDVYARLVALGDTEVMQLLAMVMAEALAVGTEMVDVAGAQLGIDVAQTWVPDAALFDLVRDRAVLTALLTDVAGSDVANCHLTTTGTKVRAVLRNAAAEKRGWLPKWFAFPQAGYTDRRLIQRRKAEA
jgi:ParB family chromosome partitioning protein